MGERLTELKNYFQQARPLMVTGSVGGDLVSNFSLVVDDILPAGQDRVVLSSNAGEMLLHEEEIYRVGPPRGNLSFSLFMDGGTELKFTPVKYSVQQPVL